MKRLLEHEVLRSGSGRGPARGRPRRAPGFTLVELLLAMAISSIVISMAFSGLITMSGSLNKVQLGAMANDEARLLDEYLSSSLMGVGGGLVRPWAALWIENNYRGDGTDRFTYAELTDNSLQCTIKTLTGTALVVDNTSGCCLTDAFAKRQVIIVSSDADSEQHWESRYVTSVSTSTCKATLAAGGGTILNVSPSSDSAWTDGSIAAVQLHTLWLDTATDELKVIEDFNLDGVNETRVVADRVIDLQGSLGYDVSPWDWRIIDTGTKTDEWLYNVAGDTFGVNDGQGLATARRDELRMVKFGVIVGAPVRYPAGNQSAQLLDGPARTRSGWVLRSFLGVTGLRNHDVMR